MSLKLVIQEADRKIAHEPGFLPLGEQELSFQSEMLLGTLCARNQLKINVLSPARSAG